MNYYINEEGIRCVIRVNDDGTITGIPFAEGNTDYATYLAWVAEGNEAEEWKPESN